MEKMEKIGSGVFGQVYLVKEKEEFIACKKIEKTKGKNEIEILKKLDHENILKFYYFKEDSNFYYIYTEYIEGDNLSFQSNIKKEEIYNILSQIFKGMKYLHEQNIVHCDLKLENIMYSKKLENIMYSKKLENIMYSKIKIIDFGNARENSSLNCKCCTLLGTMTYTAPEIFKKSILDEKIDLWSIGICLFILLTKKYPFQGNTLQALSLRIQFQKIAYSEYNLEKRDIKVLKSLLNKNPKKRIYFY